MTVLLLRNLRVIKGPSICAKSLDPKIFDCIDLQVNITPVPFKDISKALPGEPSADIRERVIRAREIQTKRFKDIKGVHCNAQMSERLIHQYAEPDEAGLTLLRTAMEKLSLSARAYSRILKVARTIADLAGSETVQPQYVACEVHSSISGLQNHLSHSHRLRSRYYNMQYPHLCKDDWALLRGDYFVIITFNSIEEAKYTISKTTLDTIPIVSLEQHP